MTPPGTIPLYDTGSTMSVGVNRVGAATVQNQSLDRYERVAWWWFAVKLRLFEFAHFDSRIARAAVAWIAFGAGAVLRAYGKRYDAFKLWSALHRSDHSSQVTRLILRLVQRELSTTHHRPSVFHQHLQRRAAPAFGGLAPRPEQLLGTRILVLKSPKPHEHGVISVDYSSTFPLFAQRFDLDRIAARYFLVLEPSWSGYCDFDLMCLAVYPFPLFVQTGEPRDAKFLHGIGANFIPIPTAGNWWVDYRVMRPLPDVERDADIVMVASWARFKRHGRVFAALAALRRRGVRLKAILLGYPAGQTQDDILAQARYFSIADQIEIYESLSKEEVNRQLNRARLNVLWSRREGFNRAIIEGMFADIPCLLRERFNYGFRYPYINERTGAFATESSLAQDLLRMTRESRTFSPRSWVLEHMTPQRATCVVEDTLRRWALAHGERWTEGLAVKVSHLNAQNYWDSADRERFVDDYAFLHSTRL